MALGADLRESSRVADMSGPGNTLRLAEPRSRYSSSASLRLAEPRSCYRSTASPDESGPSSALRASEPRSRHISAASLRVAEPPSCYSLMASLEERSEQSFFLFYYYRMEDEAVLDRGASFLKHVCDEEEVEGEAVILYRPFTKTKRNHYTAKATEEVYLNKQFSLIFTWHYNIGIWQTISYSAT